MKTIHKHHLAAARNEITTHRGVRWLHVAEQHGEITIWAEVDTDQPLEAHTLHVAGTGNQIPDEAATYLGTAHVAGFVFHVYAEAPAVPKPNETDESPTCRRCGGCGQIANDDDGTSWAAWESLPPESQVAVRLGLVRPLPCPDCTDGDTR